MPKGYKLYFFLSFLCLISPLLSTTIFNNRDFHCRFFLFTFPHFKYTENRYIFCIIIIIFIICCRCFCCSAILISFCFREFLRIKIAITHSHIYIYKLNIFATSQRCITLLCKNKCKNIIFYIFSKGIQHKDYGENSSSWFFFLIFILYFVIRFVCSENSTIEYLNRIYTFQGFFPLLFLCCLFASR